MTFSLPMWVVAVKCISGKKEINPPGLEMGNKGEIGLDKNTPRCMLLY